MLRYRKPMRRKYLLRLGSVAGAALVVSCATAVLASPEDLIAGATQAFQDEQYETVVEQLSQYLAETPHAPRALEAHQWLGRAYFALGRYPEALVELQQALGPEGSPSAAEGLYWLGEALLKNQAHGEARAYFRQLL